MITIHSYITHTDFLYNGYVVATIWCNHYGYYPVVFYTDSTLREKQTWLYSNAYRLAYLWALRNGKIIVDCWKSKRII